MLNIYYDRCIQQGCWSSFAAEIRGRLTSHILPFKASQCSMRRNQVQCIWFRVASSLPRYQILSHFIEGQPFHVWPDHKPLMYTLSSTSQQIHHLEYMSQLVLILWYVTGGDNAFSDALSHMDVCALQHQMGTIDYVEMATAQSTDPEIQRQFDDYTSLVLKAIPLF